MRPILLSLLVLAMQPSISHAIDSYNVDNNQLTIQSVQVRDTIYSNVVVTVGQVISVGASSAAASNPTSSTTTFNPYAAFQKLAKSGYTLTASYARQSTTGPTCSGTATLVQLPTGTGVTFEGQSAYAINRTTTQVTTNCPTRINSSTDYVSTDYMPLGHSEQSNYNVYVGKASWPKAVNVGDRGTVGAFNRYIDSSKAIFVGTTVVSYAVEADSTPNSVIFKLTHTAMNSSGVIESTESPRYRIYSNDSIEMLSDEFVSSDMTITIK
jgi:hypothetical protein